MNTTQMKFQFREALCEIQKNKIYINDGLVDLKSIKRDFTRKISIEK